MTIYPLKLTAIGNSVGVILPKEVLAQLNMEKGDTLFLTPAEGGARLTPYNAEFEQQMSVAKDIMKKRRNALRELSKR